jgi:hypothetical protein
MLPVLLAHHSPYLMEKRRDRTKVDLVFVELLVWQSLGWPSVAVVLPQQANCGAQLEKIEWTPNRWRADGLEADMATTLWPLSANRDCSILAVSVRALAVLRKVSSLNNCSSSQHCCWTARRLLPDRRLIFAHTAVFIYFCGSISLQLRDIMLISLISKTISFRLKYKFSSGPLLKWELSLIIRHPAKRSPSYLPQSYFHDQQPSQNQPTIASLGAVAQDNHCGYKRDVPHFVHMSKCCFNDIRRKSLLIECCTGDRT